MLDQIDRAILDLLRSDARIANAEIARRVDLAPSAVFQRIRKLEQRGVILGYNARVDASKLGSGLTAFIMVRTREAARSADDTAALLGEIPEVAEVHRVIGEDCFILKVRVRDPDALRLLLDQRIQPLPPVASTRTTIVLRTHKETSDIAVAGAGSRSCA